MRTLKIFLTTSVKIPWKLPGVRLPHAVCPSFVYLNADKLRFFHSLSVGPASFAWPALHLWADNEVQHKASLRALQSWLRWIQSRELGGSDAIVHAPSLLSSLLLIFRSFKETASLPFLFLASVFYFPFTLNGHHLPNRQLSLVLFQSPQLSSQSYPMKC